MKRRMFLLIGLTAVVSACGQEAASPATPMAEPGSAKVSVATDDTSSSPNAEVTTAFGAGVITAFDPGAETITIDHEPIRAVGWPAMTMKFQASQAVLQEAGVGDRIQFDLKVQDGVGEVTAIYPH